MSFAGPMIPRAGRSIRIGRSTGASARATGGCRKSEPVPPWHNYPIIGTMSAASLAVCVHHAADRHPGHERGVDEGLEDFDFDRDAPKIVATTGDLSRNGDGFINPPDVDDPKLAAFRDNGRKMVIYHGQADPVFSIDARSAGGRSSTPMAGARRQTAVRLFAVPGMSPCEGGVALDEFDALTALTDCVEKGKEPDASSRPSIRPTRRSPPPGARPAPPSAPDRLRPLPGRRPGKRSIV